MFRMIKPVIAAALIAFSGVSAFAADMVEPPIVEAPPYQEPAPDFGGWYIRGDLDYHWADFRGAEYITYGVTCCGAADPGTNTLGGDLDGAFSLGGGIGYQITNYLRTDLTADYWFDSDFTARPRTASASRPTPRPSALAAACQRLCRSRHLLRLHPLCRRRYRRRERELGRPSQYDRRRDHRS